MLPVRLPPAPVSLGAVATAYEVPGASLGDMATWAGASSLGSFAERYAGCWPYPPLNVPVATAWTKPGYWSGVRYMRAVVSGNPYGNGPYTVKTNTPWWGYQDTNEYYDTEQGIVGLVTRGTEGMDIYCSQDGQVLSADADGGPFILQIDLPRPITMFYYKLVARTGCCIEQNPGKWTLEGSDDEVTWHEVDAREGVAGWTLGMVRHFQVAEKRTHRHWRLVVTRIAVGTNQLSVAGLTLFAPQLRDPLPFVTTGGTPRFTAYGGATVFPDGGLDNGPSLDLDSALSQYMLASTPVVAAFETNATGLTFVTVAKFGAALSDYEWVFGFGSNDYLTFGRGSGTAVGVSLPFYEYLESAQGAIVQDQWATWTFRMDINGDDPADLTVWKDGQVVAQGTLPFSAQSLGNQVFDAFFVGTSANAMGYSYMTGSVKNVFLYDRALSDPDLAQLQAYATYDTGEPPEGPVGVFEAATALGLTPYEELSQAPFTAYGVTALESGGPNDEARVLFNRDAWQYAQGAAPITASFSTNGGLTLTVVPRFEGGLAGWERLVDYGNSQGQSVFLSRHFDSTAAVFYAFGIQFNSPDGIVVQDEWATWTVRVIDQTSAEMWKDGALVASVYGGVIGLPDVVLSTPYVGKSFYDDPYFGGSIKTAIMYDRALSDPEITQLQQYALDGTGDPPSEPVSMFSATSLASQPYIAEPVTMSLPVTFVTYNSPAVTNEGITFRRDNQQYAAGCVPVTAAFGTNGGMTMSFVLRFEDTAGDYESVLGFSDDRTAYETDTTGVERFDTYGMFIWDSNGADYRELILNATTEQDVWATWTFRVTGDLLEAWKDDMPIGSSTGFIMNDRSSLLAELGRYGSELPMNGTMKVFVLYDRPLSDIELAALHSYVTDDFGTLPPSPISVCSASTVG